MPIAAALPYIATALSAGAAAYGAKKQGDAVDAATDANVAAQDKQNQSAWNNWLLTKGLDGNNAAVGVIPANAKAVNTKLPLYANVMAGPGGGSTLVPTGNLNWWGGGPAPTTGGARTLAGLNMSVGAPVA